jgi:NAD(P)H dehydrogenase (quinone)
MTKILILYHSVYGHIERMAEAQAEGAREVNATTAIVKRVPETMADDEMRRIGGRLYQPAQIADPNELPDYDAVIFGTPTRFGGMSAQMRLFIDRIDEPWTSGKLIGKLGSVFTASASQHGGQESTILGFHTTLLHLGMLIVGLPYNETRLFEIDEVQGGSPYGASTIVGTRSERMPSEAELALARAQGRHVSALAARLNP